MRVSGYVVVAAMAVLFVPMACDDGDDGDDGDDLQPICLEPGDGPYGLTFTDVTETLGLRGEDINLRGSSISIADVDGDHWPDLILTKGSAARENMDEPAGLMSLYRSVEGAAFEDWTFTSDLFIARDGTQGRGSNFVLFADVDNDGDKDAYSAVYETSDNYQTLEDHTTILFNDGSGNFDIGPEQSFSSEVLDPMVSSVFLDYDRDGIIDVFTGHHYATYGSLGTTIQDSLFAGNGQGDFEDVTDAVGLTTLAHSDTTAADATNHKPTWGVAACDVDGDGWTDIMTTSYGRQFNGFYRNVEGEFEDLTLTSGFGSDENEDYSDSEFFRCYCVDHPEAPDCDGVPAPVIGCDNYWNAGTDDQPWRLGGNSSNTVCGDVDNDGDMDLLAVELRHWHIGESSDETELLINDDFPSNPFDRPGNETTGLTRDHIQSWNEGDLGGLMADLDNDGRLDIYVASSDYPGTYSLLWQQEADGSFAEVGGDASARVDRAHGLGLLDFDRDGDYDLVVGTSLMRWSASDVPPAPDDTYAYVLRNDSGQDANKVMLHLIGAGGNGNSNRDAVGARITVSAGGQTFTREIEGGRGLTGYQQDELMIIGIGSACEVDSVTVRWPNQSLDEVTFTDIMANYVVTIEEGQDPVHQTLEEYTAAN